MLNVYLSGEIHTNWRDEIISLCNKENLNIVFSSPSKSKIRVLQSIGRGLRLGSNKDNCKLFDLADDFTYKSKQNFTLRHFMERINIYNQEQFDYTIHRIKL